jgi:DNA-binding beta-propeller fold protein YncE
MLGPYITLGGETKGYPRLGLMNHPTDVAVDPDGDIYVANWGNHRVSISDAEGKAICNLVGDAQAPRNGASRPSTPTRTWQRRGAG